MIGLWCSKESAFGQIETFIITIKDKIVKANSTKWESKYINYLPKTEEGMKENIKTIRESRNKIPDYWIMILNVGEDELAEYNSCNNEQEVYAFVIKDLKKNGCKVLKEIKK